MLCAYKYILLYRQICIPGTLRKLRNCTSEREIMFMLDIDAVSVATRSHDMAMMSCVS